MTNILANILPELPRSGNYVVRGGGIVVIEVLALTLLSILPHLRFVQYLQLKYCNTEFIVRQ